MLHFLHPLRGSVRGHPDRGKADGGRGPVVCRSEAPAPKELYPGCLRGWMSWSPGPGWSSSHRSQGASHCKRWKEMIESPSPSVGKTSPASWISPSEAWGDCIHLVSQTRIWGKSSFGSLSNIDTSQLPGKYKVWCYHFTLYPRAMWPLKLCEVTSSAVSRMEAKANSFIRKWLGQPQCFSAAGLYGLNSLQLPLKSITLGYRQEKARLVMELRDSSDRAVADVNTRVDTGRKWRANEEVQKVMGRLSHKQIVGMVQTGLAGLGWSEPPILCSKASRKERKDLVVVEVTRVEQEELRVRSVAQGQQGRWTT